MEVGDGGQVPNKEHYSLTGGYPKPTTVITLPAGFVTSLYMYYLFHCQNSLLYCLVIILLIHELFKDKL